METGWPGRKTDRGGGEEHGWGYFVWFKTFYGDKEKKRNTKEKNEMSINVLLSFEIANDLKLIFPSFNEKYEE